MSLRMGLGFVLAANLLLGAVSVQAAPAAWHKYQSASTGRIMCSNVPQAAGWIKLIGSYNNAACRP
ncbi:hypothetical protein NYP20_21335 [Pseudomonas sp. N3-W]|uniref:Secreted protein n=1 Tax=Pseudomonas fungipugnans TaxID=3024217 RepID=A0ABT6QKP3_9PSED|nr:MULTISPECIES: hypothetical protein [unclassified Pseudomonas]MDI2591443.1 hypothetical protein [Pseudomonas sp. 681]UWF47851.1 hypothetical protein NYP20_21335 [Pseudomonas sp. N3-W]